MFAYTPSLPVPVVGIMPESADRAAEVRRLLLLAPSPHVLSPHFERVSVDSALYGQFLCQMQRLRGSVYLEDEAITASQLDSTGRHDMPVDYDSFHLLALSQAGQVLGCCRFNPHPAGIGFEELGIARAPIVQDPILGAAFRHAVNAHLESARERGYWYVEVGGWALHPTIRHTTEAIRIALLNYSLGLALGGAVGICTATTRNHSAAILRRMGGRPLSCHGVEVPPYFDSRYGCDIEVVTFDSSLIPARHEGRIRQLCEDLNQTPVVCCQSTTAIAQINLLNALRATELPLPTLAA